MCVVSMVMDHYSDKWIQYGTGGQINVPNITYWPQPPQISPAELEEFKRLLERAREYDKRNNEPECELESKKKLVKDLATKLGVEIDFL